jgi:hypothetical protein
MRCLPMTVCMALSALAFALPAEAQERTQDRSGWTFAATPYAWAMGATGNLTAKGQTLDVNAGIVDILGKTDTLVGLMANFEARRDTLNLALDFVFTQMTASPGVAAQRTPVPWLNFNAAAGANVKSTLMEIEGTAGYELVQPFQATALDGFVGVRYWHAVTDMSFGFTATGTIRSPEDTGLFSRSIGIAGASTGSLDWADPILGLQLRHEIAPHHRLRLRGDVGGFGVGSQFTWQALGAYAYEFSSGPTSWSAVLGYRAIGINYSPGGSNSIDLVLHGPVLGVSMRF